ncbi:MAG: VTT domain-containing protein [Halioglobus sp.]|nr:VTT domain-containing protein [Halioglobus sp.]
MLVATPQWKMIWGLGVLAATLVLFALLSPYISLEYLESQRSLYLDYYREHPLTVVLMYVAFSSLCIGMALPATGIFALLAGGLFGFGVGLVACTVASTLGSTLVFLWSRYLFRDWLSDRFEKQFHIINRGIKADAGYYLFSIRLLMIFPFFLVNLLCGLTKIRFSTYVIATFFSQTIVVAVWVYAGATLARLDAPSDILSVKTMLTLALVGLAPLFFYRLTLAARRLRS